MKSYRQQLLSSTKSKYFKLKHRLVKNISSGRFDSLPRRKKNLLIARIEKFKSRLEMLNISTRDVVVAGSVVTAAALPNIGNAQIDPNIYLNSTSTIPATSPNGVATANLDMDEELEVILATSTGGVLAQWDGKDSYSPSSPSELSDARDAMMVGDIDGDNDIDLIFTYNKTGGAYFYKAINNGFGEFSTTPIGVTNTPEDIDLVDWDSDGDLDVVVAANGNYFEVLQNDGTGTFSDLGLTYLSQYGVRNVEFADLDNDGDLDLLHIAYDFTIPYTSSVYAIENTTVGPGTPTLDIANRVTLQQTDYGSRYDGLVTFDFDGDGDLDVFFHREVGPYSEVKQNNFIEGTAFGFTDVTVSYLSSVGTIGDAIAGDFDNDGNDELIIASSSFNRLLSFDAGIMQGTGGNLNGEVGELTGNYTNLFVEDLNNDGNLDLVAMDPVNNSATVFHDDAAPQISGFLGNLIMDENSPIGESFGFFTFSDRQGDPITATLAGEDIDFFNFNEVSGELTLNAEIDWEIKGSDLQFAIDLSDGVKSRTVEAILKINNLPEGGNGTFDPEWVKLFAIREINVFEPGDYDMDGDMDLFVTSPQSPLYNGMLQQNDGSFGDIQSTALGDRKEAAAFIPAYAGLDLLIHDATLNELRVTDVEGEVFSEPSTLYTGITRVHKMITGDFDGDGLFEVAVHAENALSYDILVTFEEDGGGLAFNQYFLMSDGSSGLVDGETGTFKTIAIADFDGDDFGDMLAVMTDGDDLMFSGGFDQGGGDYGFNSTFTTAITQPDGGESEIEVGDLDGDGSSDIAIMRWDNSVNYQIHVDVHINDGAGNFSLDQTIPLGGEVWGDIKLADIDGDGSLDIVTSNLKAVDLGGEFDISMSIETFANDGLGNFSLSQVIEDVGGEDFKMIDVDGDDDLDIVLHGDDIATPPEDYMQLKVFRNVNVSPTAINLSAASFDEHLPLDTEVATVTIDDLNIGDSHIVSLVTGDGSNDLHNSFFSMNGTSLRLTKDVSFEITPTLNIYLSVNDGHQTFEQALVLSVNDVNQAPTGINLSAASFDEGTTPGTSIATISAVDANAGDTHDFTFAVGDGTNDADNSSFVIDGDQLIIVDESNFETKANYNVFLHTEDIDGGVDVAFVVTVNDVNQIPTGITLSSNSFDEGVVAGSEIATISAVDANIGDAHTFEFATGDGTNDADNGSFVIDGDKLIITTASKFEDKATYNIYLSASDADGSVEEAIVLNVNDINQAPTGITLSASAFDEGTASGTSIATLTAVDANAGDTHVFTLATGDGSNDADNGSFIIDGSNLIITGESQFETKASYNVLLSVSDDQGSVEQAFTIAVNDVNQAPTGITLSVSAFDEGTASGTSIATLTAVDANAGDTHVFTLATGDGSNDADNGAFIIDGSNLIITGESQFETKASYNVLLSVSDDQGSVEQAFTIAVNDVNQAPTGITLSVSAFDEGTASGTSVATILAIDANTGDTHVFTLATGDGSNDADNGSFVIDGSDLVITSESQFETKASYNVYLSVSDDQGSVEQAFTIAVNDVNQAPTGITLSVSAFDEGTTPGTAVATIAAVDVNAGDTHTFTLATGDGTNDADNGSFTIDGNNLVVTQSTNFETQATYNVYLSASDTEGSFQQAFTVSINDVNQAPTGISLSVSAFDEGTAPGTSIATISAIDANAGDTHTFTLTTGDGTNDADNGSFVINGSGLIVTTNTEFDTQASYNIYLSAADGEGATEQAFVLTVTEVIDPNLAPTDILLSAISFDEGTAVGTVVASLSAADADAGDSHTFALVTGDGSNDADNSSFVVSGNNLIVTATSNFETQPFYNVYLSTSDGKVSFEKGVMIGVNDINQAPTAIALSSTTINEQLVAGTIVASVSVTDLNDGDTHSLSLTSGDGTNDEHNELFLLSGSDLILVGDVNFDTDPSLNILIAASDGEESFDQAFTITVSEVLGAQDEIENKLGVYPNPGNDRLEIKLDNELRGHMGIKISDLAGRTVHAYESDKTSKTWTDRIDMTSAQPGIYIIEISFKDQLFSQRWIKE